MNKTFPAVKPSTKGVNKNWRKANGKIIWPTEMKMFLVNRVKEHVSVLESDPIIDPQHKMRVWEQIYKALIRRGMPESDIRTIKKTWIGLRSTTIEAFRRLETNRRTRRNTVVISDLQRAIYEVVELSRKLKATGNSVMPLPITQIKAEIVEYDSGDSDETAVAGERMQLDDTQREQQQLQLHQSQAVVMLEPLNMEMEPLNTERKEIPSAQQPEIQDNQTPQMVAPVPQQAAAMPIPVPVPPREVRAPETPLPPGLANNHELSTECRKMYEQIAAVELKTKMVQQQKEEQSLEFERQIYQRRLAIFDADIKRRNIEIEYLIKTGPPKPIANNVNQLALE